MWVCTEGDEAETGGAGMGIAPVHRDRVTTTMEEVRRLARKNMATSTAIIMILSAASNWSVLKALALEGGNTNWLTPGRVVYFSDWMQLQRAGNLLVGLSP